jgi:putative FmdB family regulatory protein
MPTYDFECVKCHYKFEQKRSFNDDGTADCPRCHGEARRLFSSVPVIFKGSGFYVTDQRKSGKVRAEAATEEKPETKKVDDNASKPGATTA